ncbi:hypothetical protein [Streptomyces sp. enrichment culture]|uniref:hypothetical protein n=1 Tax=Streptomyces sp. enrichment culture TaxID=1795815 RepID=UPI003F577A24
MKPTAQRRRDRRALLDNLLGRALRGRLTVTEAALLAEQVREEQRAYDQTRRSLGETGAAYGKHRAAADAAIREAEQRAEDAEQRADQAEERLAEARAELTRSENARDALRDRLAGYEAAEKYRQAAAEQIPEQPNHALTVAPGVAVIHDRAAEQRAEPAGPIAAAWEQTARRYAASLDATRDERDRYRAAWRSARARARKANRRADLADTVTAETKRLMQRRTTTLRERADRAEQALATVREERERALALAAARGDALAAHLARTRTTTAEPAPLNHPIPLSQPCASCGHNRNHHPFGGPCCAGNTENKCGCPVFTVTADSIRAAFAEPAPIREQRERPTHPDGTPYTHAEIIADGWGHCDGCRTWSTAAPDRPHQCAETHAHGPATTAEEESTR